MLKKSCFRVLQYRLQKAYEDIFEFLFLLCLKVFLFGFKNNFLIAVDFGPIIYVASVCQLYNLLLHGKFIILHAFSVKLKLVPIRVCEFLLWRV